MTRGWTIVLGGVANTLALCPDLMAQPPIDEASQASLAGELRIAVDEPPGSVVRATRLDESVVVDGVLDEPVYEEVAAIGGFVQQEPHFGEAATESTEAWVLFDDDRLYVTARLWDSQPGRMVANELRRDHQNILQNESFAVVLDTFYDRRNGFIFQTNALGALRDGLITDERIANFGLFRDLSTAI